jgi:hypothetical protein
MADVSYMRKALRPGRGGNVPPAATQFRKGHDPRRYVGLPDGTASAALANRINGFARSALTTEQLLQILNDDSKSHIDRAAAAVWLALMGIDTSEKLKLTELEERLLKTIEGRVRNALEPMIGRGGFISRSRA